MANSKNHLFVTICDINIRNVSAACIQSVYSIKSIQLNCTKTLHQHNASIFDNFNALHIHCMTITAKLHIINKLFANKFNGCFMVV